MKTKFLSGFGIMMLALASAFSLSAVAQTTEEGPGPSDQPSAPMEIGQSAPSPDMSGDMSSEPSDEISGEKPAETDQGVARVSMIHGNVSTQRGDSGDWSAVALNQPVVTGDKVSTGDNSRGELQLDFANTLRLGNNTQANIANLTKRNIQIQVGQGIANYSVEANGDAEPEIDTPNVSVHPSHHDGVFRIEVRPDGDTIVIVRKGEAQISTPQGSTEIRQGDMATIRGSGDDAQYKITSAPDRDDWDRWNSDRDRLIRDAQSRRHTNRYYTGTQDLDAYGQWQHVDDYGDVWIPNEDEDWVPYRNGNWTYEPYYGWTWVGYEPWGWAPYHYGRWFWYGSRWAWWPGPVYGGFYRPFWAPAYVSFWGWGGGWGFGVGYGGWGGFGWFPIGPCDRFFPWWGGYRGRFGVVNIRNVNINRYGGFGPLHGGNRFSNLAHLHDNHMYRAMSTVGAGRFGNGPVRGVAATRSQINGARMMTGNMPVVPTRASLSASGRAASPSTIRNSGNQRFAGTHTNTARPESFQQHTANLQRSMQDHHVSGLQAGGARIGSSNSGMQARGTAMGGTSQKPSAGFSARGGENSSSMRSANGTTASPQNGNRGGFRTFNPPSNNGSRGSEPSNSQASRGNSSAAPSEGNRGGFRPFTPPSSSGNNNRSSMENSHQSPQSSPGFRGSSSAPSTGDRGGFRPFTPPSHSNTAEPVGRGSNSGMSSRGSSGSSGSYWNRTAPSTPSVRGGSSSYGGSYGRSSSSRPTLDMRQPIAQPRSSSRGSYGGGYPGSSRSMPSYGGSRGGYTPPSHSSPSYGGGHSAPSYGGGGHSSPSYGGGHSSPSYGGGGHSAPSGGGGHSAPSGGGGHSSGGGGGHSSHH